SCKWTARGRGPNIVILLMENQHIDRNVSEMDGFQTGPPPKRCQVPRVSGGRSHPYLPSQVDGLPNHHCHWHPPQQCLHLLQAPPYQKDSLLFHLQNLIGSWKGLLLFFEGMPCHCV